MDTASACVVSQSGFGSRDIQMFFLLSGIRCTEKDGAIYEHTGCRYKVWELKNRGLLYTELAVQKVHFGNNP